VPFPRKSWDNPTQTATAGTPDTRQGNTATASPSWKRSRPMWILTKVFAKDMKMVKRLQV